MKQLLQNLRNGDTWVEEIPIPAINDHQVLIRTEVTLVSVGTEKMLVDFGRANLLSKIKQQPDKVRMVLDKVRTDGLFATLDAINAKLDTPIPLGYCNVGRVVQLGKKVTEFALGDRVVSNGNHAEYVAVGKNLCAKMPPQVANDAAAFTVIGAIALQGVRLAAPQLGETVAVIGLGLIGMLCVQILRAHGCQVIAIDLSATKVAAATALGAQGFVITQQTPDPTDYALQKTQQRGVDAVLITASTQSSEPMHQAAQMSRKRGRIVLVGVAGLNLSRADFYEKELTFQVSCSYGPGRYDANYETNGQDYPIGYVRWTQQRNFEAIVQLLADEKLNPTALISHRFPIDQAASAYALLGDPSTTGILLTYPHHDLPVYQPNPAPRLVNIKPHDSADLLTGIGFIGTGNYATRHLIPAFAKTGAVLIGVSCRAGISGALVAKKYKMPLVTTDNFELLSSAACNTIVISTRHNTHATLVQAALRQNKHVFVEKPLCLTLAELQDIECQKSEQPDHQLLMVGFNRRFSPLTVKLKNLVQQTRAPMVIQYHIQAGFIPADHWTQNREIGGGRLLGEVCHFIDACRFIVDSTITNASIAALHQQDAAQDSVLINLEFADGSVASINYCCIGNRALPKETLSVHTAGKSVVLDNFRKLTGFGFGPTATTRLWSQNKGQQECVAAFINAVEKGENSPIPFDEIVEVSRICLELDARLHQRHATSGA